LSVVISVKIIPIRSPAPESSAFWPRRIAATPKINAHTGLNTAKTVVISIIPRLLSILAPSKIEAPKAHSNRPPDGIAG
jgi:hypothetical protein